MKPPLPFSLAFSLVLSLLFAGCADLAVLEPKPDTSRFFYLDYPGADRAIDTNPQDPAIAIGPVTLARHLDQPRIVTYKTGNEVAYAERERWAEPLDDNVSRLLVDSLRRLEGSSRTNLRRLAGESTDFQVGFHLVRFGNLANDAVTLQVTWWIHSGTGERLASSERIISREVDSGDISSRVQALQQAVLDWSTILAAEIRELNKDTSS